MLLEIKFVKSTKVTSKSVDTLKSHKEIVLPLKMPFKEESFQLLLMLLNSNSTNPVFLKAKN